MEGNMSELGYYRRLLTQLQSIVSKLNNAIEAFGTLKVNLNDGLTVNDKIYKDDTINDSFNNTKSVRDNLVNNVIPAVRQRIRILEEEEARRAANQD
jgi:hypothetical protein